MNFIRNFWKTNDLSSELKLIDNISHYQRPNFGGNYSFTMLAMKANFSPNKYFEPNLI